jgi:hypothetical protein
MEVKKKFLKDDIELDDARQNVSQEKMSREKYFAGASGFSWRRRLACPDAGRAGGFLCR